jgi:CHAD domain-containing protein
MRSPGAAIDLRAALSEEVRDAIEELNATPLKAKGIHRCRVHLKRARALARVGREVAPGLSSVFNDSARAIMHSLSQVRDLTALADTARVTAKNAAKKAAAALRAFADALDARAGALPPLDIYAIGAGLRDLLAMAQVWPEASARQIQKGGERVVRRAREARRQGQGSRLAARRHEWRKREKDRLYVASLLNGDWPADRPRRLKANERLGEALGRERDALLLADALDREPNLAGSEKAAERAHKAIARRLRKLGHRADLLGDRLHAGGA